jgi:hypothetical protein
MARKKPVDNAFVLFDVVYQDGQMSSNRRVPNAALRGADGDAAARGIIEAQDREVGEKSGRSRGAIKSIARSAKQQ